MKAFVFPGQGSQKKGMGADLFDAIPEFLDVESEVDQILGYSIRELCIEDPLQRLQSTQYTQPSLYVVNALHYLKASSDGQQAHVLAGHSLGEYNALHAAGAFDFLTGLRLVARRGELMAQASGGTMAAILGMNATGISQVLKAVDFEGIDIANFNAPTQVVMSGPAQQIKGACSAMEAAGAAMCVPLAVSAPFHSRYMAPAAEAFKAFLAGFTFQPLRTPVVANVTGRFYPDGNADQTIKSMLARQISQPVLWTSSVRCLIDYGITEFKELGPGMVLSRLVQQIQKG